MPKKSSVAQPVVVGRTPWDVAYHFLKLAPRGGLILLALAAIVLAAGIQAVIHVSADAGSKVTFLGLFSYQKARESTDSLPTNYSLPSNVDLPLSAGITILDRSILVRVWPNGVNKRVLRFGGVGAPKLGIAARTHSATPLSLRKVPETSELEVVGSVDCYVELTYEDRVFGLDIRRAQSGDNFTLSANQIQKASMKLVPYSKH
jgi:hypothetical protein